MQYSKHFLPNHGIVMRAGIPFTSIYILSRLTGDYLFSSCSAAHDGKAFEIKTDPCQAGEGSDKAMQHGMTAERKQKLCACVKFIILATHSWNVRKKNACLWNETNIKSF